MHKPLDADKNPPPMKADSDLAATLPPATAAAPAEAPTLQPLGPAGRTESFSHPNSAVVATSSEPTIPGYDILGELGRGGMGVVYKARQHGLNRLAAVKVILSGGHAAEQDVARFRQEAEALARLEHPNIVRIYEVGDRGGLPFLSLEFCPGGSLDRQLKSSPLPPRQAADFVMTLARAMHAAHQAGLIHRDLKPANILLDEHGTPKITDFGLAKKTGTGEGLTVSGAILGTPSYMAPEQAAGRTGLITTAADIYSLGAILYECLTGRPPFRAATPIDTILQVLEQEPEPPSSIVPSMDRRLELICLRCLSKDPQSRYASADALAADLERWLQGEPVSVQPPSLSTLLRVWLRQNFGAAGWTVVVGLATGLILSLLLWLTAIQPVLREVAPSYRRVTGGHAPWLIPSWTLPSWVTAPLTLAGLVLATLSGLITARLVRPRNRQADVAAGLVSGAVTGIVFFTVGFGWYASMAQMQTSFPDIRLLSVAAWEQSGTENPKQNSRPSPARDYLLHEYPALRDIPRGERGRPLFEKVAGDLCTGLPVGIWSGILLSLTLGMAVGVSGTVLGGSGLRRQGSVWRTLLPYLEGMLPTALLCVYVWALAMPLLLGPSKLNLPIWYFLLMMAVLGAAVMGVLRRWHLGVRLPVHAMWITLLFTQRLFEYR